MLEIHPHPHEANAYRLTAEVFLPRPREEVFAFFCDAFNLEEMTPSWMQFAVITPGPIDMHEGALIDYRLKLRGLPIKWRTEITCWEPPFRFKDEQLRGPYRFWRHEHTFEEVDGGCLACDQVDYAVPGGKLAGGLIHKLFVGGDVRRIFEFRERTLREKFGARAEAAA